MYCLSSTWNGRLAQRSVENCGSVLSQFSLLTISPSISVFGFSAVAALALESLQTDWPIDTSRAGRFAHNSGIVRP